MVVLGIVVLRRLLLSKLYLECNFPNKHFITQYTCYMYVLCREFLEK